MSGTLLDTNALIWALTADPRLGPSARETIASPGTVTHWAVSVLKITVKTCWGSSRSPADLQSALHASVLPELPLTSAHAAALVSFPDLARHDPFDRMLLAQASAERLTLLTADSTLLGLGLSWVVDARR